MVSRIKIRTGIYLAKTDFSFMIFGIGMKRMRNFKIKLVRAASYAESKTSCQSLDYAKPWNQQTCKLGKIDNSHFPYETKTGIRMRYFPYPVTSEDSLTSFLCFSFVFRSFFSVLFSKHSYLCNKKKTTRWLEDMKFIFFPQEDKTHIFAPPCNIFYLLYGRLNSRALIGQFEVRNWL